MKTFSETQYPFRPGFSQKGTHGNEDPEENLFSGSSDGFFVTKATRLTTLLIIFKKQIDRINYYQGTIVTLLTSTAGVLKK